MRYFPLKFSKKSLQILALVKDVLKNNEDLLPLTVRQIFYQIISLQDSPLENSKRDYGKLSRLLVKARYCGEISFDDIEDRTRYTSNRPIPLDKLLYYYYPEAWKNQPCYVEVFVEKEGLRSFFVRVLRHLYVAVTPMRGFDSLSDVMEAAERLHEYEDRPRFIFVFSDFDPSGECIFKDFEFRLKKCLVMLGEEPIYYDEKGKNIEISNLNVQKVALTLKQIEKYGLPPKFVKSKDPRARGFIQKYGPEAVVELDAMPPKLLQEKILESVVPYLDVDEVKRIQRIEQRVKTEGLELLKSLVNLEDTNIGEDR
jgi:hypothetical protein